MVRGSLTAVAAVIALSFAAAGGSLAQAPAAQPAAPAQPPAAQSPAAPSAGSQAAPAQPDTLPAPSTAQAGDPFGEEVQMAAKTVIRMKGNANWDSAFETLVDSFKSIYGYMERSGIKPAGSPVTVYTSTDDTGFQYEAGVPIASPPADAPKGDIEVGTTPAGRMLKFVHRGSYDAMDTTYEAITNYLDTKQLEAQDNFIEEYVTDPLTTPAEQMVVNVYVPVRGGAEAPQSGTSPQGTQPQGTPAPGAPK